MKILKRIIGLILTAVCMICFVACVGGEDYGTLTIADIENLQPGEMREISAVFSKEEYASAIEYEFEGNAIKIEDGKVTALSGGSSVSVTATTKYHRTTFTVTTVPQEEPGYYDIYIIAGQSNAAGYSSKAGRLDGVFENISYAGEINAPRNGGVPAQSYLAYPFLTEVKDGLGLGSGYIGPEYGMAEKLNDHYSESKPAMILKTAAGGTSLLNKTDGENNDWGNWYPRSQWGEKTVDAKSSPMGVLYQSLVDNVAAVCEQLVEHGYTPRIQGMAWMQGEADLSNLSDYKTLLKAFIADIRSDLKEITGDESLDTMPFVIGEIATSFDVANNPKVPAFIEMQRAVAAEMQNVYTVQTNDLIIVNSDGWIYGTDRYHFNKDDCRTLGNRFGETLYRYARFDEESK